MSRERLPLIGSSGSKTTAKPPLSSPALQRRHQDNRRKRSQPQTSSSSSSSSHPHPAPPSILLSDTTMTPWGGLALSESSFTSIPPPPPPPPPRPPQPPPPPPPPPPAPQPTPSTPYRGRQNEDEELSSFNSQAPSPPVAVPPDGADGGGRELRARRRVLPQQRRVPRPPRLPPLRPVTNLSFSRSFTFSFFELPLHQSPRCRAERIRNLMLLLRQIHY